MGYTLPGWLDEILDFIGINFPNVDEDDYREMATAMRDFADTFEGHGAGAHKAVAAMLASSEGWAAEAIEKHWDKVKTGHLDKVPELARLFADACDVVADIIFGMKTKAEAELAVMAGSVGLSLGLAAFTGGLSALLGAAEITAMRQLVKRIVDEAADRIVEELVARVTEPVNAKLEAMIEDAVLDLAEGAFSMPADGGGGGHGPGHGGMQLASAGGGVGGGERGGPHKETRVDHFGLEDGSRKVSLHGGDLKLNASDPLGRAKTAFGRTKGKDPFTEVFESVLHGALDGSEKALGKITKHVTETLPDRVRAGSKLQNHTDLGIGDKVRAINTGKSDASAGDGHRPPGRTKDDALKIDSAVLSRQARALDVKETCGDPIDMATGQMVLAQTDAHLPGILPLTLRRTHLSGYDAGVFFGSSWASTVDERLEEHEESGGMWWYREDGSVLVYPRLPDFVGDRVQPAEGMRLPLTYVSRGTAYALTVQDAHTGLTRSFESAPLHDRVWWLASIEDRNGNTLTIERTPDGTPAEITHSGGYRISVEADAELGRLTAMHVLTDDGPVRIRGFRYDDSADLTEVRNAVNAALHLRYDTAHRVTGWRDSTGTEYNYTYDPVGRVVETRGTDGILNSSIAYAAPDSDGTTAVSYTDSLGNTTVYRANHHGQIVAITDPLGHTTTQTWDRHDHLLSRTDPLGRTTCWEWSDAGDLTCVTTPDGATTHITYNDLHLPLELTGPDGTQIHQDFDPRGNRTVLTTADGAVHRFTHHPTGAVATATNPLGATTVIECDAAGMPTAVTDPRGARTQGRYDALGRLVQRTDALGNTTTLSWNRQGRLERHTAPDGATETWTWDGEGNCTSHTDPLGNCTRFQYGPFSLLHTRTSPDGAEHRFRHDTEQRLTQVTNALGQTWHYAYDSAGQLIAETDFDSRTTTYTYDAAGQPTARTAAGETTTYTFDAVGRLTAKNAGGTHTEYHYDAASRLVTALSPNSRLEFTYDSAGRMLTQTTDGATLHVAYDLAGRRISRTTPSGAVTTWTYEQDHRPATMAMSGHTVAFDYDALGRELTRDIDAFATLSSAYHPSGRLTEQSVTAGADQHPLQRRSYTYRADGHLTAVEDQLAGRRSFDLDTTGRVTAVHAAAWSENYAYDAMGNQTSASWPSGHPGHDATGPRHYNGTRITRAGHVRYEHDAHGRITLRQKRRLSRKPETWRYEWNTENQLAAVITPDGTHWHYLHDPLGRRTAKLRMADDGTTVVERTDFIWDGATLCEQTTHATGSPERVTLTWDHQGLAPLTQTETKSLAHAPQEDIDRRFFAIITDQIGTPTELVDESGTIAWRARATLWGTISRTRSATAHTPLRFSGQYHDPETGLNYNYFRHYDPETARYTTLDPLGLLPAPNPATYVDNPHTQTDPLGLTPCDENDVTWGGRVRYGALGPHGRATGMQATITQDMLGGKTNPQVDPAGWQSGQGYNRAHLLAAMIGGSNRDPRNFVTMHSYANSPVMRQVELQVRNAVRDGETIEYSVTPIYADNHAKIPLGVTIEAHGDKGFQMYPHGSSGDGTNIFTIWNRKR
jgi:RHS repeat-associated protein